jgi:hypothetical protein
VAVSETAERRANDIVILPNSPSPPPINNDDDDDNDDDDVGWEERTTAMATGDGQRAKMRVRARATEAGDI